MAQIILLGSGAALSDEHREHMFMIARGKKEAIMIDCGGDEYSVGGDYTFDRVPLFDFDICGIEFSIFYNDRSRDLWGTPSGFLYKMV